MPDSPPVNEQITDAVAQSCDLDPSATRAVAMGSLLQAMSQSLALAAHNATSNQQHMNILATATTSVCVTLIQGGMDEAALEKVLDVVRGGEPPTPPGGKKKSTAKKKAARK